MRKAVLFLLLLVGVWTGLWFVARVEAGRRFDLALADEAMRGRVWTCPNRAFSGFPFALRVACSDATFKGQARGQGVDASVAHLVAGVALMHPRRIAVTVEGPFTYRTSDGAADVKATWKDLAIDLDGLPSIGAVSVHGRDIAVHGQFDNVGEQAGAAGRLDATFTMVPNAADPAVDFTIAVGAAPMVPLDVLIGDTSLVDVDLAGRVDRVDIGEAQTPEDAIERWRVAGGHVALASSRLVRGASQVTASGTLLLDDEHRPQGRLDAQFIGLEPVMKHFGISGNLAAAGALLGAFFGGPTRQPTKPGALALPISLQDGRVGIGPIRMPITLPPLY